MTQKVKFSTKICELVNHLISNVEKKVIGTVFAGETIPTIAIQKYIERVINYLPDSDMMFLQAIVYIKRLICRSQKNFINQWTIHRIFITSVLISTKFIDDFHRNNHYYSILGGISTQELLLCELELLWRLSFKLKIEMDEIENLY